MTREIEIEQYLVKQVKQLGGLVLPVFDDAWKKKCVTCVYLYRGPSSSEWRCNNVKRKGDALKCFRSAAWKRHKGPGAYCIDAREEGKACGPKARLWSGWLP